MEIENIGKKSHFFLEEIISKDDASWQYIIYDFVKNKQIDPWDVDIVELTNKFLSRIEEMTRENLHISSKVLLAAAILVKMKAEILHKSLMHGEKKKESKADSFDFDDTSVYTLFPKIPFERERKITLAELMEALKNALKTEERRIRKKIQFTRLIDFSIMVPKPIDWTKNIEEVYKIVLQKFNQLKAKKIFFSQLLEKKTKEEKISFFVSLVHLDFQKKLIIQQEGFLSDIEISLYG